jgi:hypothetical protein
MFIPDSSQGARPQYILLGSRFSLHARDFAKNLGSRSQIGKIADRWETHRHDLSKGLTPNQKASMSQKPSHHFPKVLLPI